MCVEAKADRGIDPPGSNARARETDLATGHDRPFGMTSSPEEVEQSTVAALGQAVAALEAKSPEDLPAYRQLVLDVAESVAAAAKGVSPQENEALDRIRAALGSNG